LTVSAIAVVGWIVFACVFGSALIGMGLRRVLPEHHLSSESKDVVKLGIALIATMTALVLSLLLSSAKSSFDERNAEFAQMAGNIVLLDRLLAHYGPEAKPARQSLRAIVEAALAQVWPDEHFRPAELAPASAAPETIYEMIQALSPQGETQRSLQAQALATATGLAQARWLLFAQASQSPIPLPFLVVLVFWLCIIFASFGLYAPANPTVVATLGVCAPSVAGAIFLILELALPFVGVIRVSSAAADRGGTWNLPPLVRHP
jgi:hypothetical protein